jgi:hypothetical protein
LRKAARGGFPDSAVTPGNHGHFVVQPAWHPCFSFKKHSYPPRQSCAIL